MKAEREKRAVILKADGEKQAAITAAEGEKEAAILRADAVKQQRILEAEGEATMVGYRLDKTVSEHGSVTRGVCHVTDGKLDRVVETFKLTVFPDGTIRDVDKNPEGDVYAPNTPVSMNFSIRKREPCALSG